MKAKEVKTGIWRHYKGGIYEVLCCSTHTETGETMVVYQSRYGDRRVWTRPVSMWEEVIPGTDGVKRFTFVGFDADETGERDYIDRMAAIKRFSFATMDMIGAEPALLASDAVEAIRAIPSADVVEVIRCKDCKYWRGPGTICTGIGIDFEADDYCSDGRGENNG